MQIPWQHPSRKLTTRDIWPWDGEEEEGGWKDGETGGDGTQRKRRKQTKGIIDTDCKSIEWGLSRSNPSGH